MKLVRKIVSTTLISAIIFIVMFGITVLLANFMLNLKNLSNQTIKVMSDWNALDRITNDLLYYRLDSVSRLASLEKSWLSATDELGESLETLRNNKLLELLPDEISQSVQEAWYLWLFSNEKLSEGQNIFRNILINTDEELSAIDEITFYEKLLFLIKNEESYEKRNSYQSFLSHMYVLDITGENFSFILKKINEDIPDEIDAYIYSLLLLVGAILIIVVLVSIFSARKLTIPIIRMADAVRNMGEEDYPPDLELNAEDSQDDELAIIQNGFSRMALRIHALYEESFQKEKEKRKAQFRALQNQINPHFLYNTLGTLRMKAAVNGQSELAESIQSLSRLLRNTINKSGSFITVEEELLLIEDYLNIMQIRYKQRLNVSYMVSDSVKDLYIPSLLCQPVIENALLHGLNAKLNKEEQNAELKLSSHIMNDILVLEIFDNGRGIDESVADSLFKEKEKSKEFGHIGLKNIHDRIQLLFGSDFGIKVESKINFFTRVMLSLPVIREENDAESFNSR